MPFREDVTVFCCGSCGKRHDGLETFAIQPLNSKPIEVYFCPTTGKEVRPKV